MKIFIGLILFFCLTLGTQASIAQVGVLRGGAIVLSNGTYAVTIKPPSAGLTSYSLALDTNKNSSDATRWLKNDGTGNLSWDSSPGGLTGNGVQYTPGEPQNTSTSGNYLFYLRNLSSQSNVNSPGGFIASAVVDGVGSSATGLTINVTNTLATATGMSLNGVCSAASSLGATGGGSGDASTVTGVTVNVTGGGTNYAGLFNGGNVGFGTTTPGEQLEVNGNIRISGLKGLKITEGTNATMGKATLVAGTVVVNTSKVTANSRIFLMDQNGGANAGTPYISARTASTSFTITSTNAADVSDVAWWIVEP